MRNTVSRFAAVLLVLAGLLFVAVSPAGAQGYEGTSLEEGIFFVPAEVAAGSAIDFSVTGLVPNSDVIFTLTDQSGADAGDVEVEVQVQGAVVLRADAQGNFNGAITLPPGIEPGSLILAVEGTKVDGSVFSTSLAVAVGDGSETPDASAGNGATTTTGSGGVAATTGSSTENVGELALTGSSSSTSFMSGLLLIGAGAGLVLFAAQAQRSQRADT